MPPAIHDYFLPAYAEDALRKAGKLRVTTSYLNGITLQHLEVDRDGIQILGQALRQRRDELMAGVDLSDGDHRARRLAGLRHLAEAIKPDDAPLKREALEVLPQISGFSRQMIEILLDAFTDLMAEDTADGSFPPYRAGLEFVETAHGYARHYPGRLSRPAVRLLAASPGWGTRPVTPLPVLGLPAVVTNVCAGNVPGISLMQTMLAVIVGAASLGKNASGEPYYGPRCLRQLVTLEAQEGLFPLSDLAPLVTFRGTRRPVLEELVHQGDHLQVTGGIASKRVINHLVRRLRVRGLRGLKRRVSGHWHKVSFDVVAREYLTPRWIDAVAFGVAVDNSMFNTQGCLSAQQVFVEGDETGVRRFAASFIESMRAILERLPKGAAPHERLREMYQWYERKNGFTILTRLRDMQTYPFFVAYDDETADFSVFNALNRSIVIRRVEALESDLARLLGRGEKQDLLQSCGVAVPQERLIPIAEVLGRAGVNRIVATGSIWDMRLDRDSWDGYLPPGDLIAPQAGYWTTIAFHEVEQELGRVVGQDRALLGLA